MPKKSWTVTFEDGKHLVEFSRNDLTGRRIIKVDGVEAYNVRSGIEVGSEMPVTISGHSCAVISQTNGFSSSFNLKIDYVAAPPKITPRWTWLFIVACVLIPIITIGGAIPALIGFGGATACYTAAKGTDWSTSTKVMTCIMITVVTRAVFLGFLGILASHPI